MAITSNTQFNHLGAFRFWCQKVLPAVYDDSLSYYELLCKVVDYLNQVVEVTNTQTDAINELQELVNSFIDGTIDPYIEDKIDQWFEEQGSQIEAELDNFQYHMVVIGDSWSTDQYGVTANNLWCARVANQLGCVLHNYSLSGMGYLAGNTHFGNKVEQAENDTSFENNKVRYVFLQGSLNDRIFYETDASTYSSTVLNVINQARAAFPKATIIVMSTQNPLNAQRSITNMSILQRNACMTAGVAYINMVWLTLGLTNMTSADYNYHPSMDGQRLIAHWVMSNMFGTPILPNRDFAADETEGLALGTPIMKLRGNTLYIEYSGRSADASSMGSFHFANNILESLEYLDYRIPGVTSATITSPIFLLLSTTEVQLRDSAIAGTANNGFYNGIVSTLY